MFTRFWHWLFKQPENKQIEQNQETQNQKNPEPIEPHHNLELTIENQNYVQNEISQQSDELDFKDSWDMGWDIAVEKHFDDKLTAELPLIFSAYIEYLDRDGNFSSRDIIIKKFIQDKDNGWVMAFCEWRQSHRTFRYNRIQKFIDKETGEIIASHEIAQHLFTQFQETTIGQIYKCWHYYNDVIAILVTVSRLDGKMMAKERKIITDFLVEIMALSPNLVDDFDTEIKKFGEGYDNVRSFNQSLRQFIKDRPDLITKLYQKIEQIVGTDKKVTTDEEKYLNWAKKILIIGE